MWQLLLELLLCAAVITYAPSPQIGLGVWGLFWWISVFWRWATATATATAAAFSPGQASSSEAESSPKTLKD